MDFTDLRTREEKLATWVDPPNDRRLRVLTGSLSPFSEEPGHRARISDHEIHYDQIQDHLLNIQSSDAFEDGTWHFRVLSLPRLRSGKLVLSIPKQAFQKIQEAWHLHPRTIEVFLSNNGAFATFNSCPGGRTSLVMKVASSRATGFDCVSVNCDPGRRTTYVLYQHLSDEDTVFATLLSTPELCIDPHFFVGALYRSHHQHIEAHRLTIDDTILGIERATNIGTPGRLASPWLRRSLDEPPASEDPKRVIQRLSYCQTDLAVLGHAARCSLECGRWLVQSIDEKLHYEQGLQQVGEGTSRSQDLEQRDQAISDSLRVAQLMVRDEVEYIRRRTAILLSQVEQLRHRTQSQTDFMLSTITQKDSEYTAAIAVDGKRDSIAMRTISILGIIYLPPTFVATLFSVDMFEWGHGSDSGSEVFALRASPSVWIYFAVTVPLTLATFVVWVLWAKKENQKTSQRFMAYRTQAPEQSAAASEATSTTGFVSGEKMV
ncbi:hypothetical protein N657DRAFT_646622 [Parathielavia appendiculata]|uniref:Uncharacterized protein n=1 Tax=Parathielavia appendiculata TaxID=2587402 RepID=A0AAN6TYA1_9PEZI|nr:hypothetical protein N657DRAFT_646622 [Parathielavia appendiculata]